MEASQIHYKGRNQWAVCFWRSGTQSLCHRRGWHTSSPPPLPRAHLVAAPEVGWRFDLVLVVKRSESEGAPSRGMATNSQIGRSLAGRLGGGGIAVRDLPQFTAILPQFFSDASIQKFHFSPEENSFPPFTVARHTVRRCVLICPACHLCGKTLFCFCVPKMSSISGGSDSGNGKSLVKRGKGQGGQKAPCATQILPSTLSAI